MPVFKVSECCGYDLKTVTRVIGILYIVLHIGFLIQAPIEYSQGCISDMYIGNNILCSIMKDSSNLSFLIGSSILDIILQSLMIYGSEKEIYIFMLPLLILHAMGLLLTLGVFWYIGTMMVDISVEVRLLIFFMGHLIIGFALYLWMIIYNRSQEIKRKSLVDLEKNQYPQYDEFKQNF